MHTTYLRLFYLFIQNGRRVEIDSNSVQSHMCVHLAHQMLIPYVQDASVVTAVFADA